LSASISTTAARRSRAPRAVTAAVASAAMVLGGALALAPAAHAADNASVSGVLTAAGDSLVDDVTLYRATPAGAMYVDDVETDPAGAFAFGGLPAGKYTLQMDGVGSVREQYLGGTAAAVNATTFTLAAGQARTGVAFAASMGAPVSGTITTTDVGGADYASVALFARDVVGGAPMWMYVDDVEADGNGVYAFENVVKGTYTVGVEYDELHALRFYGNVGPADLISQTPPFNVKTFDVAGAAKSGINVTVPRAGSVNGQVKIANGEPFYGDVVAVNIITDPWGYSLSYPVNGTNTDSQGRYDFPAQPGTYTLAFLGENAVPQSLGGNALNLNNEMFAMLGMSSATRFPLAVAQTKTINTTLRDTPYVANSITKVNLSKPSRAYGTASTATVTVVGKGSAAAATGSVKLMAGSKVIGSATVVGGKANFTLPATLKVGKHPVKATYSSTGALRSSSAVATLTVTKAGSKTKATATKKSSVKVTVKAAGTTATGKVKVLKGKKVIATGKLKNGKVTVKLSDLAAGKHKVTVKYVGSSTVKGSKSGKVTVKIKG
jgi:hypothetical protein